jgi:PAS domain S-box-containing protein
MSVCFTEEDAATGVPMQELRTAQAAGRADDARWMRRRGGERFFATGSVTPIHDPHGRVAGFLKVFRDETRARQSDEECRRALASERTMRTEVERQAALLRATVDAIPDALYIGTADGITECNQQALDLLGASSLADLQANIGMLGSRFNVRHERGGGPVDPSELPFVRALHGEQARLDTWATKATGEDVFIRGTAAPIVVDGRIQGAVAINSDLTERVQLEEKRRELERVTERLRVRDEEFRAIVLGVRDYAIFTVDLEGRISSWHIGAQLMKGYTDEEAIGMPFADLFTPEDRAAGRPRHEMEIAATTGEYKGEGRRLRKSGDPFEAAVVLTALRGPNGQLIGYLKLTQDITRRKHADALREQVLRHAEAARADAERASHAKGEFLATISHELRTPLSAILGWSHLLERGLAGPDAVRQGLAAITRNARVQVQLIEDLLDMNRIESGQLRLEMQRIDVAGVVAGAVEAVQLSANAKGLRIDTAIDPHAGPVSADPGRLQQVVWNLLANAVKFTPAGGQVSVSATRAGDQVEIAVADTGQGMDAAFIERAFDRFQQQDATSTRRHGGLGLGLAIVRQLTELHGGTVRAASPGPGRGSTFTVSLPACEPGAQAGTPARAPAMREEDGADPPIVPADAEPPSPERGDHRLDGFDILLIDDEPDGRAVSAYTLRTAGAKVIEAASAREGMERFLAARPAAILCDIGMPEHDGYEFIEWVREVEREQGRVTPAAALTAYARTEDRRQALQAGYQAHLVKPMDPSELLEAVVDLLQDNSGDTVPR